MTEEIFDYMAGYEDDKSQSGAHPRMRQIVHAINCNALEIELRLFNLLQANDREQRLERIAKMTKKIKELTTLLNNVMDEHFAPDSQTQPPDTP